MAFCGSIVRWRNKKGRIVMFCGSRMLCRFDEPHVFDGVTYPAYERFLDVSELEMED